MVLRVAASRDDVEVLAVNDPFIDAKYMVKTKEHLYLIFVLVYCLIHDAELCYAYLYKNGIKYNFISSEFFQVQKHILIHVIKVN